MKLVRAVGALGLAGFAAVSGPAGAADEGWYLGFGIGQSREENHHDRITQQLLGSGFTTNSIDDDSKDTAWKLFGVSWNALAPLAGVFFGLATVAAYAIFRLGMGAAAALADFTAPQLPALEQKRTRHWRDERRAFA